MVELGVTNGQSFVKTKKSFKIEPEQNYRRIVAGRVIRRMHWIPVLIPKRDLDNQPTGEFVSKNIPINCNGKSVFDKLAEIEDKLITDSSQYSTLREQIRFLYMVIHRGLQAGGKDYLGYDEYSVSIQKGLEGIEKFKGKDGKIKYTKIGTWDHIITKTGDGLHGTKYNVAIDPEGICDFTEAEMALFEEAIAFKSELCGSGCFIQCSKYCDKCIAQTGDKVINLYDIIRPMEPEDMIKTFEKLPIDLNSKSIKFPDALISVLEENFLNYVYKNKVAALEPEPMAVDPMQKKEKDNTLAHKQLTPLTNDEVPF